MIGPRMDAIRTLHPAYFALVMATGIVSIAAHTMKMPAVPLALLAVNAVAFPVLWALTAIRVVRFSTDALADVTDHQRGVGFFTAVAGTSVFGSQILILLGAWTVAMVLWVVTLLLWIVLVYTVFTALTIKKSKPTLDRGISGGWLVAVVATESVATLGTLLAPGLGAGREPFLFVSLTFWLAGGMLYIWLISLIFYRYTFFEFSPSDLMPPYWINMGAMAISTLAGTLLLANAGDSALLKRIEPFTLGMTLLFWATATWWIPMLLILGFWRHVSRRFPLTYSPLYWGAVFPLGMYTVCSYRLASVAGAPFLLWIPRVLVFVAVAAWVLTFVGLVRSLLRPSALRPG
ncbi:MAG: tellurite resistance/C4-dicarboxylate transporter family protein [Acidobacteriota bacterium]